ncbi:MAG: nitrogenase [Treponema sp.]|jgi:nitrogenase molybdenum-iron protein NifN|nr:nitrogenase [Treponema sp.]
MSTPAVAFAAASMAAVKNFTSTRNACKLCAPLGASLVLRGIEGCIPLIHGSQGCSTYIRRYIISHFREPIDIASSNFTEASAIFGGRENLFTALDNLTRSYRPQAIGITSTCLAETIGEDVPMYLKQYEAERERGKRNNAGLAPVLFYASTPSYRGTHIEGFHEAVYAVVSKLADGTGETGAGNAVAAESDKAEADVVEAGASPRLNLVSGFVSAEDIRELHAILISFAGPPDRRGRYPYTLFPDYSESLDGPSWETYQKLPQGGTRLDDIRMMGNAAGTLYLGRPSGSASDAGRWLLEHRGIPLVNAELPIGIENSDSFFASLSALWGREIPETWISQRGRLVDAYIDGHKYVNGKRAVIYGEEDFVCALASFLDEIGVIPVIAATGAENPAFKSRLCSALRNTREETEIMDDADFAGMLERAQFLKPDFVMGHSKGLYLARDLKIPLVRCGFPIHDRIGGQRILHLGYRGTLNLFDLICNAIMEEKQARHEAGYTYI